MKPFLSLTAVFFLGLSPAALAEDHEEGAPAIPEAEKLNALIIDGQNNHKWQQTTPYLKAILENSGLFTVSVATSPPEGEDLYDFNPSFDGVDVVVSNYNGKLWGKPLRDAFETYVKSGGGFVPVHAADNAFPDWNAYSEMCGVGGWNGRNEKSGPYLRWEESGLVRLTEKGRGGSHGPRREFLIEIRDTEHPTMKGLPAKWLTSKDELYDRMRGPAKNINVLATAFAAKEFKGTDAHEPMLMVLSYGEGRVFHTTLGHDTKAMSGVGFQVTLTRGAEWAATGSVTQEAPDPATMAEDKVTYRDPIKKVATPAN